VCVPFCSLVIGLMVGIGCLSVVASGGVSLVSQERSIEAAASTDPEEPGNDQSASGFGRFHEYVHATLIDGEPGEGAVADATQDSTISRPCFTRSRQPADGRAQRPADTFSKPTRKPSPAFLGGDTGNAQGTLVHRLILFARPGGRGALPPGRP